MAAVHQVSGTDAHEAGAEGVRAVKAGAQEAGAQNTQGAGAEGATAEKTGAEGAQGSGLLSEAQRWDAAVALLGAWGDPEAMQRWVEGGGCLG